MIVSLKDLPQSAADAELQLLQREDSSKFSSSGKGSKYKTCSSNRSSNCFPSKSYGSFQDPDFDVYEDSDSIVYQARRSPERTRENCSRNLLHSTQNSGHLQKENLAANTPASHASPCSCNCTPNRATRSESAREESHQLPNFKRETSEDTEDLIVFSFDASDVSSSEISPRSQEGFQMTKKSAAPRSISSLSANPAASSSKIKELRAFDFGQLASIVHQSHGSRSCSRGKAKEKSTTERWSENEQIRSNPPGDQANLDHTRQQLVEPVSTDEHLWAALRSGSSTQGSHSDSQHENMYSCLASIGKAVTSLRSQDKVKEKVESHVLTTAERDQCFSNAEALDKLRRKYETEKHTHSLRRVRRQHEKRSAQKSSRACKSSEGRESKQKHSTKTADCTICDFKVQGLARNADDPPRKFNNSAAQRTSESEDKIARAGTVPAIPVAKKCIVVPPRLPYFRPLKSL